MILPLALICVFVPECRRSSPVGDIRMNLLASVVIISNVPFAAMSDDDPASDMAGISGLDVLDVPFGVLFGVPFGVLVAFDVMCMD